MPKGNKYRKKPVLVEAFRFSVAEWESHFDKYRDWGVQPAYGADGGVFPVIRTLEGEMAVKQGDFIIRGVKGEHYPCRPDIFAATYEPAKEDDDE